MLVIQSSNLVSLLCFIGFGLFTIGQTSLARLGDQPDRAKPR